MHVKDQNLLNSNWNKKKQNTPKNVKFDLAVSKSYYTLGDKYHVAV